MFHALGPDTHVMAVCQPSVPVLAAVALMEATRRPLRAGDHDADGRADRHAPQPDRRQPARRGARHRLVPRQRHHAGAVAGAGLLARRLSGLPAALRLHEHEPRPAHHRPQGVLHAPREERRRQRREAPRLLRRVSGGDGPHRRVLPADGGDGVRPPRAAEGRDDASRRHRSIRRRSATSRCSPSKARTTTSPASARPRPRTISASTSRTTCALHYLQPAVGHYGVFNGSRFRSEIVPRILDFQPSYGRTGRPAPKPR